MEQAKAILSLTKHQSIASVMGILEFCGGAVNLLYASVRSLFKPPFYFNLFLEQTYQLGVKSVSLTTITAISIGFVMCLQFGIGLERFGGKLYVPKIVGMSIMRELGPVLTCLMLAGRVGAGIAAEIGSMKVTQQIDAIRALGTDPIKRVVIPRILAMLIIAPLLTIIADVTGIFGGMFLGWLDLNISPEFFFHESISALQISDFTIGIAKTFFFGLIIGVTACYHGLNTSGGTQGVGQSTTKAVVSSCILITISDFFLTKLFMVLFEGGFSG